LHDYNEKQATLDTNSEVVFSTDSKLACALLITTLLKSSRHAWADCVAWNLAGGPVTYNQTV